MGTLLCLVGRQLIQDGRRKLAKPGSEVAHFFVPVPKFQRPRLVFDSLSDVLRDRLEQTFFRLPIVFDGTLQRPQQHWRRRSRRDPATGAGSTQSLFSKTCDDKKNAYVIWASHCSQTQDAL